MKNFEEILKENNLKYTSQREIIYKVLYDNRFKHLTAKEILKEVQKDDSSIGIATLYRNIDTLMSLNLIVMIENKYELVTEDKLGIAAHYICKKCKKIIYVSSPIPIEKDIEESASKVDFQVDNTTVYSYGICSSCREKEALKNDKKNNII